MSRYNSIEPLLNDIDQYEPLRKKRGLKYLNQLPLKPMHHPTLLQRVATATEPHLWSTGDHFYKLAHKYYGDPKYWWVIAWYNGYPTEGDMRLGALIDIPLDLTDALEILGM